jgi:hypothetical protein
VSRRRNPYFRFRFSFLSFRGDAFARIFAGERIPGSAVHRWYALRRSVFLCGHSLVPAGVLDLRNTTRGNTRIVVSGPNFSERK